MRGNRYASVLAKDQNVLEAVYRATGSDSVEAVEAMLTGSRAEVAKAALDFSRAIREQSSRPRVVAVKKAGAPRVVRIEPPHRETSKAFTVTTDIVKSDDEEQTVFGWASITDKDGVPVVDRQGDTMEIQELAKSAYDYVINTRAGGNQHKRGDDGGPLKVADMIESMVFTKEKVEKMGLPEDTPTGWWVGFKVSDPESWDDVKSGRVTGFSVHGKGRRVPHGG